MPDPVDRWKSATVESFEQVAVAGTTVLLRIAARSDESAVGSAVRPTLVLDDGQTSSSFAAIPAPPDTGEILRAAYAVTADVVGEATVFSLAFPDFSVIALPDPAVGSPRAAAPLMTDGGEVDEERRSDLRPKLAELSRELAGTRQESSELRLNANVAQAHAEAARIQLLNVHMQAAIQSAELEAIRDLAATSDAQPLDASAGASPVEDPTSEIAAVTEQLGLAERERDAARAALAEVEGEHARTHERLAELEVWSAELERRLADTTSELAQARTGSPHTRDLAALEQAAFDEAHTAAERDLAAIAAPSD